MRSQESKGAELPRPGAMIEGLELLLDQAERGTFAPASVAELAVAIKGKVSSLFESSLSRLPSPAGPVQELDQYLATVKEGMIHTRSLLLETCDELLKFSQDHDPVHLALSRQRAREADRRFLDLSRHLPEGSGRGEAAPPREAGKPASGDK